MERGNSAASRIFMQLTAQTIAEHLGGTVEGNPLATVSSLAKIEEAGEGTLSFIANPKYEHHIYTTGATAVLVKRDFLPEHPVSATLIRVDDPYTCLGTLLGLAAQFTKPVYTGIEARELMVPIFQGGELVYQVPDLQTSRAYCQRQVDALWDEVKRFENPHNYYVDLSQKLWNIKQSLLNSHDVK